MDELIPNLWMGDWNPLLALRVEAIVDCQYMDLTALVPKPFLWIPFIDGPLLPPRNYVKAAVDFIHTMIQVGHSVLVHCAEGHNRSGLICGAYLIQHGNMLPDDAIALIRAKRGPKALSNQMFVAALQAGAIL